MTRSFTPVDLVQLPALDAVSTVALGTALVTAANSAGKLPPAIGRAHKGLMTGLEKLKADVAAKLPSASSAASTAEQTMADRRVDSSWIGLFWLLKGIARLPEGYGDDQRELASQLLTTLFPGDVEFTQLRFRQEWAESETRLQRIQTDGLDATFKKLHAEVFLQAICGTHADYGKALGITEAQKPAAVAASLRPSLDQFLDALRAYVVKVSAHVEPDDEESAALARALLAPLASWQPAPTTSTAPATPVPPAPAPAVPA